MDPESDGPLLDAALLAQRFGLTSEALRRHMRSGMVRGTVENGTDEDAGRTRLTVRFGNRIWVAVIDGDGSILHEELAFAKARPR